MQVLTRKDKICLCCGKKMKNVCCNVKYCNECKKLIKNGNIGRIIIKERPPEKEVEHVVKHSFADVVKAANAEGLSYGKYCLKYGI